VTSSSPCVDVSFISERHRHTQGSQ